MFAIYFKDFWVFHAILQILFPSSILFTKKMYVRFSSFDIYWDIIYDATHTKMRCPPSPVPFSSPRVVLSALLKRIWNKPACWLLGKNLNSTSSASTQGGFLFPQRKEGIVRVNNSALFFPLLCSIACFSIREEGSLTHLDRDHWEQWMGLMHPNVGNKF